MKGAYFYIKEAEKGLEHFKAAVSLFASTKPSGMNPTFTGYGVTNNGKQVFAMNYYRIGKKQLSESASINYWDNEYPELSPKECIQKIEIEAQRKWELQLKQQQAKEDEIKSRIRFITDHRGYVSNKKITDQETDNIRLFLRKSVKGNAIYQDYELICWQTKDGYAVFRYDNESFLDPRSRVQYKWRDGYYDLVVPKKNVFKGLRIYIIYNLVVFDNFNDLRDYAKFVLKKNDMYNKLSSNLKKRKQFELF